MKKDNVITIMLIMGIIIFYTIVYVNGVRSLDEDIYNYNWFNFDFKSGMYRTVSFDNDKLILSGFSGYDGCNEYVYNKKNMVYSFDCNKKIGFVSYVNDELILNINDKNISFFDSAEKTYNYEFNKYFGMSEIEFINKYNQVDEIVKVDFKTLEGLINNKDSFVLILKGDRCINYECYIFNEMLEKLIVKSFNVYTFDSSNISEDVLKKFNKISMDLVIDNEYYNNNYPRVIVFNNGVFSESFLINCNGFDCSKYNDIIDKIY